MNHFVAVKTIQTTTFIVLDFVEMKTSLGITRIVSGIYVVFCNLIDDARKISYKWFELRKGHSKPS